jgi:hypothetical protein
MTCIRLFEWLCVLATFLAGVQIAFVSILAGGSLFFVAALLGVATAYSPGWGRARLRR